MKLNKSKSIFFLALILAGSVNAQNSEPRRFAVKASAEIGLGDIASLASPLDFSTQKTSGNNFGVDFGYTFWAKPDMSLEANIGVGYNNISTSLALPELSYSYNAPANADEDGNQYVRYYQLSDISQKVSAGNFTLPIYITYNYRFNEWISVHADAGVRLGFKTGSKIKDFSARSYCYGIYPQYDNLLIDADYLNNFGHSTIAGANVQKPEVAGLNTAILLGIGAEIKIAGPVSLDLGIRYMAGLTNIYKHEYSNAGAYSATTAPVTYNVADGECVNSLTGYMTKSKLNSLELKTGLIFRF